MDAVSYNAILTACAQGGHWGGARRLIEGLAARGVLKVCMYSYNSSLHFKYLYTYVDPPNDDADASP